MATRIPLVLGSPGLIEQLQAGDTLGGTSPTGVQFSSTASGSITIGQAVYAASAAQVQTALANSMSTAVVVGLSTQTVAGAAPLLVQSDGVLTLTTGQWDAVAGTSGGLTVDTVYYLDPTSSGQITATPPVTVGQVVVPIGIALSATDLLIRIGYPTLL